MDRAWTIMRKEFIHIIRDPRTLSVVFIMPITLLLLLGYAVAVEIEDIPTAVYDMAKDSESREFIDRFWHTHYFKYAFYVNSTEEIVRLIDSGEVRVGLVIPPDFGAKLGAGKGASVEVIIDGSDPTIAQTALFVAQTIGQAASVDIISRQLGQLVRGGSLQVPIDLRARLLYNPDMRMMNFMIPGLIGAILQVQTLILTAFAIVRERERGTLEQLIVTPIKPWELMLGKIVPFVLVAFINVGITLLVGTFWFKVPVSGDVILLLSTSLLFLLGSLGLGILISTLSQTQMQAMHLASFVMLPAFILSGFIVPRENMPLPVYYAGYLIPLTYFIIILRGIILKGVGVVYLWKQIAPMAIFSIVTFVLSALNFHKSLE